MTASTADSRIRYLIVSDGRSGTTLLASILGMAGADFGLPVAEDWNPSSGSNEHPDLVPTTEVLEKAEALTALSTRYPGLDIIARGYRSRAKRKVGRLLEKAPYHKSSAYMAPYAFKLGYSPRIIASYRQSGALARSKMLLQRTTYPNIVDRIEMTYRNALIGIYTFGGCAVSFEEIIDPGETGWMEALSEMTGMDYAALAEARARLVKSEADGNTSAGFRLDPRLEALYEDLRAIKGRYLPPSTQYLRQIGGG